MEAARTTKAAKAKARADAKHQAELDQMSRRLARQIAHCERSPGWRLIDVHRFLFDWA